MIGFCDGSGISWTTCKQSAPHSRQITTPTPPRHSVLQAGCSSWRRTDSVKANILPLSLVGPFDVVGPVGICLWLSHNPILPALTLTHDPEF